MTKKILMILIKFILVFSILTFIQYNVRVTDPWTFDRIVIRLMITIVLVLFTKALPYPNISIDVYKPYKKRK